MPLASALSVFTPSDTEIVIERSFRGSIDLVFDCFTKPDLIRRWLTGPDGWSFTTCKVDLRVGGNYRYVWRGPDGELMGMVGQYQQIEEPGLVVSTEKFDDDFNMGSMLVTIRLSPLDRGTKLHQTIVFESKAARDAAIATGMSDGMGMSFDRLDSLLAGQD